MVKLVKGTVRINAKELNLDLTLLGGQSFRWAKHSVKEESQWVGVAYGAYWILRQDENCLSYEAFTTSNSGDMAERNQKYFNEILQRYLRLEFDLPEQLKHWRKSHTHFDKLAPYMKAVRVLNQEPLENILSFICSQNNNIKRISSMIDWLCGHYGEKIGNFESKDVYDFPKLESFIEDIDELENRLRSAKFGYRAKFIAQSVGKINEFGGLAWFEKLRSLSYQEARRELVKLPGIGFKVADCICLMSLGHLESVPIDTHIFKIAQSVYMPQLAGVKAVTPKIYEDIAENFRKIYGSFAGWTQAVLFCSELQQFQNNKDQEKTTASVSANKKRKK